MLAESFLSSYFFTRGKGEGCGQDLAKRLAEKEAHSKFLQNVLNNKEKKPAEKLSSFSKESGRGSRGESEPKHQGCRSV